MATTRMACQENQMNLEQKVLEVLNTSDNFTMTDDILMLTIGRRAPLATFVEMSDNEIVNQYWQLKELNGEVVESSENQEKEQYMVLRSDGSMSGFAGCNQFSGEYQLLENN